MSEPVPPVEQSRSGAPLLAQWLGYAGLVPFIAGALELWLLPGVMVAFIERALLTYAAVILSFMGAVHWGLAMRSSSDLTNLQLGLSVVPALVGWVILMLPPLFAYPAFILSFLGLLVADLQAVRTRLAPRWYAGLRLHLTIGVVLALGAAYAQTFVR